MEVSVEAPVQEIVNAPVEAVVTVVVGAPVEVTVMADVEALAEVDVIGRQDCRAKRSRGAPMGSADVVVAAGVPSGSLLWRLLP